MISRRVKAATLLVVVWGMIVALHLVKGGHWLVYGCAGLLAVQAWRLVSARPPCPTAGLEDEDLDEAPTFSLLVAAHNEEGVIERSVRLLCELDYPAEKFDVWVINDRSTDSTPRRLEALAAEYPRLNVVHRSEGATGAKSGALNHALPLSGGAIVAVFDADAEVPSDLLRKVAPLFRDAQVGAVQVRKAMTNARHNFWTRGQAAEMALDCWFQQQRIAIGGAAELRGSGQFVRRAALDRCGGWNEQTITDDLDLAIRLQLCQHEIRFLRDPPVCEEAVESLPALWKQRNRWAEGGYQRFLDYARPLATGQAGFLKTIDILSFFLLQYFLPMAFLPDLVMSVGRGVLPLLAPLSVLLLLLIFWAMFAGLRRVRGGNRGFRPLPPLLGEALIGALYMFHWVFVMVHTTARMAWRRKPLEWVKTVHSGLHEPARDEALS